MDEFRAMLKAGVARRKKLGQNMRSLAAEIGGTQGTISNVATGNTAMRELTAMLDPDETNTPADHPRAPAIAGRPRRGH